MTLSFNDLVMMAYNYAESFISDKEDGKIANISFSDHHATVSIEYVDSGTTTYSEIEAMYSNARKPYPYLTFVDNNNKRTRIKNK